MKKLFILMILVLGLAFGTSCDKEKDPMTLSEFVIGEWTSQYGTLVVNIYENSYDMKAILEENENTIEELNYNVDNENDVISIEVPNFEQQAGTGNMTSFNVTRNEEVMHFREIKEIKEDGTVQMTIEELGEKSYLFGLIKKKNELIKLTMTWEPVNPGSDEFSTLIWTKVEEN
ncbi:MAG: hypothetical protein U9N72_05660 [Bacteroidota bacterium]|nr:hypothetical protein [Bacteroidota bacterium]